MRLLVLSAMLGAVALSAIPASAQVVIQEPDRGAVVVRDRDHDNMGRHEGWRSHHAECREVRVRTRLPDGRVIVKTRRSC